MIKKVFLTVAAVAALVAGVVTSCQQENVVESPEEQYEKVKVEIEASLSENHSTRTVITEEGKVLWKPDDAIAVSFGRRFMYFISYNLEPSAQAMFVGEALVSSGRNEGSTGTMGDYTYWGIYPGLTSDDAEELKDTCSYFDYEIGYDFDKDDYSLCETDGKSVTTTLPTWQKGLAGSFDDNLFITLAKSNDYRHLSFYNVCGGVRFSIKEEGVRTVTLRGNDGENLAGRVRLAMDSDGIPVVKEFVDGKTSVTLALPGDETFIPGEWYYIVTLPSTLSKGYTLTLSKGDYTIATLTGKEAVEIKRAGFATLETADATLSYSRVSEPQPNQIFYEAVGGQKIDFANTLSSTAKLVSNEYKDSYGILTFDSPVIAIADGAFSGVDELKTVRLSETEIIGEYAFSGCDNLESVYMPDVHTLQTGAFQYCRKLKSMDLSGISGQIPSYCFSCCESLDSVVFPAKSVSIGEYAFSSTGFKSMDIPSSVTSLGYEVFRDCDSLKTAIVRCSVSNLNSLFNYCYNLESVYFSGSVQSFNGLRGCKKLREVVLPSGIETLGGFDGCSSLETLDIPETVQSLDYFCFSGCENLKSLDLPGGLTSIGSECFKNCSSLDSIAIPDNVSELEFHTFYNCTSLKSARMPRSLKYVGEECFYCCSSLSELEFYSCLKSIGQYAFRNCLNLETVKFHSKNACWIYWNVFVGCPVSRVIYVPSTAVDSYREEWAGMASFYGRPIETLIVGDESLVDQIGGHEYVDLGLSVYWASCNVGASKPEEPGAYFAWGEVAPKDSFAISNYRFFVDSLSENYSKYVTDTLSSYYDGKIVLDLEDDAAYANWSFTWRMPTYEEFGELNENCEWEWTELNDVPGYLVTGPNGNSIFMPSTGLWDPYYIDDSGGWYWTSGGASFYQSYSIGAGLGSEARRFYYVPRTNGICVRPVSKSLTYNESAGTK